MTSNVNNSPPFFYTPRDCHHEVLPYMSAMFFNKYLGIYKASMDYLFLQIELVNIKDNCRVI